MQIELFDSATLGHLQAAVRTDPNQLPYTMAEFKQWGSWERFPWDELRSRAEHGWLARGAALVAALLQGCARRGVRIATVRGLGYCLEKFSEASAAAAAAAAANDARIANTAADK